MARAAEQLRRLLPFVCLCVMPILARAQAAPEPATSTAAPAERASRLVLFLLPADAGESQPLRDALLAQFALIDAQLVFEVARSEPDSSLSRRLTLAQQLAVDRSAIAVFWIDTPSDGRWLLHMMDAKDERVIVRAVDAAGERRSSAIEAIAVMTRSSTRALIEDQTIQPGPPPGSSAAPTTPTAASVPTASSAANHPSPPDWVRLWVGYTGDYFAQNTWQHGIALGGGFLGLSPLYASVGVTLMPTIEVTDEPPVAFSVRRLPFAARFGYRLLAEKLSLDAELGLLLEWLHRPASQGRPAVGTDVTAFGAYDTVLWAVAPRLRAELRVVPAVGLYAGGGIDILLNDFAYVSNGVDARYLLRPNRLRPVAELGISFYP